MKHCFKSPTTIRECQTTRSTLCTRSSCLSLISLLQRNTRRAEQIVLEEHFQTRQMARRLNMCLRNTPMQRSYTDIHIAAQLQATRLAIRFILSKCEFASVFCHGRFQLVQELLLLPLFLPLLLLLLLSILRRLLLALFTRTILVNIHERVLFPILQLLLQSANSILNCFA